MSCLVLVTCPLAFTKPPFLVFSPVRRPMRHARQTDFSKLLQKLHHVGALPPTGYASPFANSVSGAIPIASTLRRLRAQCH